MVGRYGKTTGRISVCLLVALGLVLTGCVGSGGYQNNRTQPNISYSTDPDVLLRQIHQLESELANAEADRARIESVPQVVADGRAIFDDSWNWNLANNRVGAAKRKLANLRQRLRDLAVIKTLKR